MNGNKSIRKKISFYKKIIGIGIILTVAIYCIPELQEKIISGVTILKDEWRKLK